MPAPDLNNLPSFLHDAPPNSILDLGSAPAGVGTGYLSPNAGGVSALTEPLQGPEPEYHRLAYADPEALDTGRYLNDPTYIPEPIPEPLRIIDPVRTDVSTKVVEDRSGELSDADRLWCATELRAIRTERFNDAFALLTGPDTRETGALEVEKFLAEMRITADASKDPSDQQMLAEFEGRYRNFREQEAAAEKAERDRLTREAFTLQVEMYFADALQRAQSTDQVVARQGIRDAMGVIDRLHTMYEAGDPDFATILARFNVGLGSVTRTFEDREVGLADTAEIVGIQQVLAIEARFELALDMESDVVVLAGIVEEARELAEQLDFDEFYNTISARFGERYRDVMSLEYDIAPERVDEYEIALQSLSHRKITWAELGRSLEAAGKNNGRFARIIRTVFNTRFAREAGDFAEAFIRAARDGENAVQNEEVQVDERAQLGNLSLRTDRPEVEVDTTRPQISLGSVATRAGLRYIVDALGRNKLAVAGVAGALIVAILTGIIVDTGSQITEDVMRSTFQNIAGEG